MWTVMRKSGPSHTRNELINYLIILKKSGRENIIKVILEKKETYIS